jgi:[protein-PII] uridylyltransferase
MRKEIERIKNNFLQQKISNTETQKELYNNFKKFLNASYKNITSNTDFFILATGSFSRKELCFHSDLDILILTKEKKEELYNDIVSSFIYPLWDEKIEIGYSIRTINEFIDYCSNDIVEWIKIFDSKLIVGSKNLYREFLSICRKYLMNNSIISKNIKELFILNDNRRDKMGRLTYSLEPDIKNSPGCLRDINLIVWIVKTWENLDTLISANEKKAFKKAKLFFLNIRNLLHAVYNKKVDLLNFENQKKIASIIYPNKPDSPQYLMKKFYIHTEIVDYLYEYFREKIFSNYLLDISFNKKIDKNFYIKNYKLHIKDNYIFKENPKYLLKAFYLSQKYKVFLSYKLIKSLQSNVNQVKPTFLKDKSMKNLFFNILEKGYGLASTLRFMNQLNFLSNAIPEFKRIKYKITYDFYHKYTVDIHSILVVQELRNLFAGKYIAEYPFISALSLNIPNKKTLLFAALIHDIGKGVEGKESHLIKGEIIADKICKRISLTSKQSDIIKFLVKNHTLMTNTALRRDLKNEEEILNFAKLVKKIERLNHLFLISFADLKGVSPDTLDKWKYSLLQELYIKTFSIISHKKFEIETLQEKIAQIKAHALEIIPKNEEIKFSKFLSQLSRRLIQNFNEEEILKIYNLIKENKTLPFVDVEYRKESNTYKFLEIYYNYSGIFNKIVAVFTMNNLNIISAEIYTNLDGTIIDFFETTPIFYDDYFYEKLPKIKDDLNRYLSKNREEKKFSKEVEEKIYKNLKNFKSYNIIPIIKFNNDDNEFFTILEIIAQDFTGFLYLITKILAKRGVEIQSSKISTQGIKAIDTFYITDINGNKIMDRQFQEKIKNEILDMLNQFAPYK